MPRFRLHHISLYVRDVDVSAVFYRTVLGLSEIPNRVGKAHIRWFTIDDFRTVHLTSGDQEGERPRQFATHVALATQEFDKVLSQLQQHGVTFESVTRKPGPVTTRSDGVRQAYFQDPDGHWIEVNDADSEP